MFKLLRSAQYPPLKQSRMSALRFRLVFFSPHRDTRNILNHLFRKFPQQLGKVGNYEECAFVSRGIGQFRPGPGALPTIGMVGELESVEEDRVEMVVNDEGCGDVVRRAVRELIEVHPYEEVVYYVSKLEDF